MAKDDSVSVYTTEVRPDYASDLPINQQYTTEFPQPELPQKWPAEPHPLTADPATERWLKVFDITLCLIPLALIAKAILCIIASHLDKDTTGPYVDQAHDLTIYLIRFNHQLTTIFTVVFILIITTVVRRLALYMAQEGATVAKLEQLQASISLPGTLKAIWSLRTFTSRTSAALIIIWGWFYLGSQATTSEYEYRTSGSYHKMQMAYYSPQKPSLFSSEHSVVKVPDVTLSNLNSKYTTFSLGSSHSIYSSQSYDLNGAALVPLVNADGTPGGLVYVKKKLGRKRHGWYDVSRSSGLYFASFIGTTIYTWDATYGIIVNNLEGDYTSDATYFNVTCQTTDNYNASAFPKDVNPQSLYTINSTDDRDFSTLSTIDPPRTFDVWGRLVATNETSMVANETSMVAHSSCRIREVPIQMKVHCSTGNCAATRMRFVPGSAQINRTAFDNKNFAYSFFNSLLLSDGIPNDFNTDAYGDASSVAGNLVWAFSPLLALAEGVPLSFYNLTLADAKAQSSMLMSFFMTSMINTYYQASLDPTQGSTNDITQSAPETQGIIAGTIPSRHYSTGTIKGAIFEPQYRLSIPWVIVDLISCKILLAAAIMAFWLRQRTLAPDIFGYVSSLTRDNPHLNLPEGGSGMSGLERARALKKVKVRIADVADENGVGKVGLRYAGPQDDSNIQMAHLKRDRHYV